jgi:hypothetical protein
VYLALGTVERLKIAVSDGFARKPVSADCIEKHATDRRN